MSFWGDIQNTQKQHYSYYETLLDDQIVIAVTGLPIDWNICWGKNSKESMKL